jgi:hypothetical protein
MKNIKILFTLLVCLSTTYSSNSQNISSDSLQQLLRSNPKNFYKQLNQLRSLEEQFKGTEKEYFETLGVLNSFCGNYQRTHENWSKVDSEHNLQPLDSVQFKKYRPVSAKILMDSIAKNNQIVILNEGHHIPQNRASTMCFLETFYKNGFRYIAMESVKSLDSTLNQRKYPITGKTGYYFTEPCYGDLARQALKMGFIVIPYEYEKRAKTMTEREEGQADNIIKNLLKDNPKAKLLMHVGYSHGVKFEPDPVMKLAMMGYFLKQKSGIEPFVIGQENETEKANHSFESPYYVYATKKYSISEPTFFVKNDGKLWANNYFDACLFLPRSIYKKGRPTWLNWSGKKKEFLFDTGKINTENPFLIQAFLEEELPNGVPIDQIEIMSKSENKALLLYLGKYVIRVLNASGDIISEEKITIN